MGMEPGRWTRSWRVWLAALVRCTRRRRHRRLSRATCTRKRTTRRSRSPGGCRTASRRTANGSPNRCPTCASSSRTRAAAVVGESVTDAEGVYVDPARPTPAPTSCASTSRRLPEGLAVEDGKDQQVAEVAGNQNVTRAFFLGEDNRDVKSKWSLLPQTLANGLEAGDDHRHHVDRPVADLRHDRSVELRPRRDGHLRCVRRVRRSTPIVGLHVIPAALVAHRVAPGCSAPGSRRVCGVRCVTVRRA